MIHQSSKGLHGSFLLIIQNGQKSLKVKIFLNFYGTYKEVRNVADIYTTVEVKEVKEIPVSSRLEFFRLY